jgi:hypothetical protein
MEQTPLQWIGQDIGNKRKEMTQIDYNQKIKNDFSFFCVSKLLIHGNSNKDMCARQGKFKWIRPA